MIRLFKRSRPTRRVEPAKLSIQDLLVLRWWGYTVSQWDALPAHVRAAKRDGYYAGQGLAS